MNTPRKSTRGRGTAKPPGKKPADSASHTGHRQPELPTWDTLQPIHGGDDPKLPAVPCLHFRPFLKSCLAPVSVGDLLIVEQNLCGYTTREIAQIENIMARERKEFTTRDTSRVTTTTETSFERETEESKSTKVDERFSLTAQSQEAQSQQTSLSGNVSASYNAPAFSASISANASYTSSKESSYATSQEYAKTITEEATKRVREAVSEKSSVTVLNESVKTAVHGFNNSEGTTHIRGVYQWVNQSYKAQLFDYGKRLFLQFLVPEPAYFLRDIDKLIEREELAELKAPVHPRDRGTAINSYRDISESNYAGIAADYDVTDIKPPPPQFLTKGKGISYPEADPGNTDETRSDKNEPTIAKTIDSIVVDQGYHLIEWQANIPQATIARPDDANFRYGYYTTIGFSNGKGDANLLLVNVLGTTCYYLTYNDSGTTEDRDKDILVNTDRFDEWHSTGDAIEGEVPITVGAEFEGKFYFNLLYRMERNDETFEQWQIDTYAKILAGYQGKLDAYEQALKQAEILRDSQIGELKVQPREETFRRVEAEELRKHCIDVLTRHTAFADFPPRMNELPDGRLEINLDGLFGVPNWQANNVNGTSAVFFEEAFEWESITYKLYPYFWTDRERWHTLFREVETGDSLFDQFLRAGFARVVVPLRPSYERSVLFFLRTCMIWAGGEVPAFDDDNHLALLEELHNSTQLAKGEGQPVGEPWDIELPTSFVYLREEPGLPEFVCDFSTTASDPAPEPPGEEEIEAQEDALAALIGSDGRSS